jgi:hypothetical protein
MEFSFFLVVYIVNLGYFPVEFTTKIFRTVFVHIIYPCWNWCYWHCCLCRQFTLELPLRLALILQVDAHVLSYMLDLRRVFWKHVLPQYSGWCGVASLWGLVFIPEDGSDVFFQKCWALPELRGGRTHSHLWACVSLCLGGADDLMTPINQICAVMALLASSWPATNSHVRPCDSAQIFMACHKLPCEPMWLSSNLHGLPQTPPWPHVTQLKSSWPSTNSPVNPCDSAQIFMAFHKLPCEPMWLSSNLHGLPQTPLWAHVTQLKSSWPSTDSPVTPCDSAQIFMACHKLPCEPMWLNSNLHGLPQTPLWAHVTQLRSSRFPWIPFVSFQLATVQGPRFFSVCGQTLPTFCWCNMDCQSYCCCLQSQCLTLIWERHKPTQADRTYSWDGLRCVHDVRTELHGATRQRAIAKSPAKWSAYQISSVIVVFVIIVF